MDQQWKDIMVFCGFVFLLAIFLYHSLNIFFLRRRLFREFVAGDASLLEQFPDSKLHHMLRFARSPLGIENNDVCIRKKELLRYYRFATIWAGLIVAYIVFVIMFV